MFKKDPHVRTTVSTIRVGRNQLEDSQSDNLGTQMGDRKWRTTDDTERGQSVLYRKRSRGAYSRRNAQGDRLSSSDVVSVV